MGLLLMNQHNTGTGNLSPREHIEALELDEELTSAILEQYGRLQSMNRLVRSICEAVEEERFDSLLDLFAEREGMISGLSATQAVIKPRIPSDEIRQRLNQVYAPLMHSIEEADEVLLKLLQEKKELIIERSKEAQLQRLVSKYSENRRNQWP